MFTMAAGLLIFTFVYLSWHNWAGTAQMGRTLFAGLSGFAMFYALIAGPLATTDCLARERREGTLGLLFLTDLHTYDVVLGKAFAASLDLLLSLHLHDALHPSGSLQDLMRELSRKAQERGLTPEILESILHER